MLVHTVGAFFLKKKSILLGFSVKKEAQYAKIRSFFLSYAGTVDMKSGHRASRLSVASVLFCKPKLVLYVQTGRA